ncbi:unnamed protein product, partial [marine sediment metagenome]
ACNDSNNREHYAHANNGSRANNSAGFDGSDDTSDNRGRHHCQSAHNGPGDKDVAADDCSSGHDYSLANDHHCYHYCTRDYNYDYDYDKSMPRWLRRYRLCHRLVRLRAHPLSPFSRPVCPSLLAGPRRSERVLPCRSDHLFDGPSADV